MRTDRIESVSVGLARKVSRLALSGLLASVVLVVAVSLLVAQSHASDGQSQSPSLPSVATAGTVTSTQLSSDADSYLNCRFGVGQAANPVISYDIASLNAGWYANWGARADPARPAGTEYVQFLRVSDGAGYGDREHPDPPSYRPSGAKLAAIVAGNPGALWVVGNEPDCIWQDNVLPENYAVAYHEAYEAIKALDPTARVSAGGIVQPTPLRLAYLDAVLDAYVAQYGRSLPTDAWNIHTYILREERDNYGCDVPPGSDADAGKLYDIYDSDDLGIFQARIWDFRDWMYRHGYRDTPLIISEYGTLLDYYERDPFVGPDGDPFDEERAREFMYGTFDFLRTASDTAVGYAADEDRLVQRWLWYSLDDIYYGGILFDPNTTAPMALGVAFGDYTGGILPAPDLLALGVKQIAPVPLSPADGATVTLEARVSNAGNVPTSGPITVRFLDADGGKIGEDRVIADTIAGCAAVRTVTTTWSNVEPGTHTVQILVDPENEVSESDEENNEVAGRALVASNQVFLPLITRLW